MGVYKNANCIFLYLFDTSWYFRHILMYHIKLNKPCNFCYVSMTSWKFIICIVYFSVFCPYLVGEEHYFLKNLVFQPEKVLFEKNRNTEQIFLTSTPYLYCTIFRIMRILCKQSRRMILLLHFSYLVCPDVPVQDIW